MRKGINVVGHMRNTLRYHSADQRGRMYMCGCMPGIRIGSRCIYGLQRRVVNRRPRWNARKWGDAFRINRMAF